jgi:hypothetical protein
MTRTPEQLRSLSEHLLYEAQMLFATANRLRGHVKGEAPLAWDQEMATIESFALHTRVLIEFLWREPNGRKRERFPDDAFAAEFFAEGEWAQVRPHEESSLEGVWQRAGAEIAHLSHKRVALSPDARTWEFDVIAGSIGRAFRVFLEHVDRDVLCPRFESELRASWPPYLNAPIAMSFPPTAGAFGVATGAVRSVAELPVVTDVELIP